MEKCLKEAIGQVVRAGAGVVALATETGRDAGEEKDDQDNGYGIHTGCKMPA